MLELMPPFYFLTFAKVSVSVSKKSLGIGLDEIFWSRHSVDKRGARPEFASTTNFDRGDKIWQLRAEVDVELVAVGQVSSGELCICPSPLWLPGHCLLCPLTGHSPLPERRIYHRQPMAPPACNVYTPGFGIPDLTFPSFYSPMLSLFH